MKRIKKALLKILILVCVFIVGVAGTALLLNSVSTDDRSELNDATFPEVMIDMDGTLVNRMYGYATAMQADFTRDSVTPLDTTKQLTFVVNPYASEVTGFSYEIRTSDGSKVLENKKIKAFEQDGENLKVSVEIGSDLRVNQEYSMQISLDTEGKTVYYYTRIVYRSQVHAGEYAAFVKSFYESCLDKNAADGLSAYLEPENNGAGTNYSNININSALSEVSWGTLKPQLYKEGIPIIKDINETTASISIDYQLTSQDDNGNTEVYDVTEFYRMRYMDSRIYLLDFQRSANQIFDASLSVFSDDGIVLGVRNKDVEYMVSEEADIVAFVQQGDLWSCAPGDGKVNRVFSLRKSENEDCRDSRNQHDIKIIRVNEDGDIDFVLYGYMNRGAHEGYEGIGVYHYNNDKNVVEERAFIPISESFEFLKRDLGKLSYVNENNELFLLLAQKLYCVNIENNTYEVLEDGIKNANFTASENGDYAAWLVTQGDDKGCIHEIQMDTKETRTIEHAKGERLRVVGYMNQDLIYGILQKSDILTDSDGHTKEGIHTLRIEDFQGDIKKEYHQESLYITDISVGSTLIEFELSSKSGDTYQARKKDTIMNNKNSAVNTAKVELISASRTGVRVRLALSENAQTDTPLAMYSKISSVSEKNISLDTQIPQEAVYYVYAKGGLDSTYTDPAKAVLRADDQGGVVLNRAQQYVWERGNKKTKIQLDTADIPDSILQGTLDTDELKKALKGTGTVTDLSGCSLDSVLYEVSAQRPVIAKTGNGTSVVIVGYDEYNTWLYDPVKQETYPYGMNDSTDLFQKAGNIFITYIESVNY